MIINQVKIFRLLLGVFILSACARTSGATPTAAVSPSASNTSTPASTETVTVTSTPQDLEPKLISSTGTGDEIPWYDVNYSPDGRFVFAVDDKRKNLRWIDMATKQELLSLPYDEVRSGGVLAYSRDNSMVAINTAIGIVDLYNMNDQKKIFSFDQQVGIEISNGMFSPDHHYFAYQAQDRDAYWKPQAIFVWDLEKTELVYMIPAMSVDQWKFYQGDDDLTSIPPNPVNPVSFSNTIISPDGKFLSTGDGDGNLFVWNLPTGKIRYQIKAHAAGIVKIAFSPDGQILASGGSDGTVRLWNMSNGKLSQNINGLSGEIFSLEFTPDGKQLKINLSQNLPQSFDLATGKLSSLNTPLLPADDPYVASLLKAGGVRGKPQISPDGKTLMVYFGSAMSFTDIASKTVQGYWLAPKQTNISGFGYNQQGHVLAVITRSAFTTDKDAFAVWDAQRNQQIFPDQGMQPFNDDDDIFQDASVSANGDLIALYMNNVVEIWSLAQRQNIAKISVDVGYIYRIAFSQDNSQLYVKTTGYKGGDLYTYDVKSGQQMKVIKLSGSHTAFGGVWFVGENYANQQSWVELWNLESMSMQKLPVPGHVTAMCFTPDASLLHIASSDELPTTDKPTKNKHYFWQTKTGQLLYVSDTFDLNCAALSPNGQQMASIENGKVNFWDTHAISELARQNTAPSLTLPTATLAPTYTPEPTNTPQPTLGVLLVPTPVLPAGAIVPENGAQLQGSARFGQGDIQQILWPADSTSILTVGSQGIYEYDAKTLAQTSHLPPPDTLLTGAVLLADGRRLAAGQAGEKAQVWDLTNNKMLAEVTGRQPVISPDGKILAFLDGTYGNQLHLWEIESGKLLAKIHDQDNDLITFSPDSQLVAAIQYNIYDRAANRFFDDTVHIWDAHTGQIINSLDGPYSAITSLAFSDDGKRMIGVAGGSAWIWELRPTAQPYHLTLDSGRLFKAFRLFDVRVTSAALSPNGAVLAVASSQRDISLYDKQSNHVLRQIKALDSAATLLRFSPDGRQLLSVDENGRLTMWNVQTGKLLADQNEHTGPLSGLRFGDDDNLLIWGNNTYRVIHPDDASVVRTTLLPEGQIFAASPDGLHLANYLPYHISLWNAQTGQLEQTIPNEPDELYDFKNNSLTTGKDFTAASFSKDSKYLAVGGTGNPFVYNLSKNSSMEVEDNTGYPEQIIFSPSAGQLASCGSNDCEPVMGNIGASEGLHLHFSIAAYNRPNDFAFNPAGNLLAAVIDGGAEPDQIMVWQSATARLQNSLTMPAQTHLTSITFNADGRLLAIGQADGKILIIETESLKVLATLINGNSPIDHLAISNNGQWLAAGSSDGSISFWRVP